MSYKYVGETGFQPGFAQPKSCILFFFFFNLFIYFWLCWVFVSVRGLSLVVASGGHSSSLHVGLSLSQPLLLQEHRLQTRRLSSCGSRAQLLRGMWDLPRPGLEPASPALAGTVSTTVPPGKPNPVFFKTPQLQQIFWWHYGVFFRAVFTNRVVHGECSIEGKRNYMISQVLFQMNN